MTAATLTTSSWLDELSDWHVRRVAEVTSEHGIASLVGTTWLTDRPAQIDGLPGVWSDRGGAAYGEDGPSVHRVAVGESRSFGSRLARVIAPRTGIALRVFDPAAASRTTLTDIAAFAPDERWRLIGRFEPAAAGSTRPIEHVDGARTDDAVAGTVRVEMDGYHADLLAFPAPGGQLQLTFADATNGHSTAQFRFLTLDRPDADGSVSVDFNRAYLPPCAFSDHYLCPLPPAQNRLPVEVTAGETVIERELQL